LAKFGEILPLFKLIASGILTLLEKLVIKESIKLKASLFLKQQVLRFKGALAVFTDISKYKDTQKIAHLLNTHYKF
jgi:hypothetical protein